MNFYLLDESDELSERVDAYPAYDNMGDARTCDHCGQIISLLIWQPPFRVELEMLGREFADIIFHVGNGLLLSEKVVDLYHGEKLTGLSEFSPVEVTKISSRRRKRPEPPTYYYAPIQDGPARVDPVASEFEWISPPTCAHCLSGMIMRWKRVQLEPGTWCGEDIFSPIGLSSTRIITPRFKQLCQQHELRNVSMLPIEQYGHDFYPGLKDISELEIGKKPDRPLSDREALDALALVARLDVEHLIKHYLYLPTKGAAKRAQIALVARDFQTEGPYPFLRRWGLQVHTPLIPEESAIASLRQILTEIAEENDGEYHGWDADLPPK